MHPLLKPKDKREMAKPLEVTESALGYSDATAMECYGEFMEIFGPAELWLNILSAAPP